MDVAVSLIVGFLVISGALLIPYGIGRAVSYIEWEDWSILETWLAGVVLICLLAVFGGICFGVGNLVMGAL